MNRIRKTLLRALLGAALLAAVLWLAKPAQVWATLRAADPLWLLFGLAAGIASNVISALRWRALAHWLAASMGIAPALRWYFQAIGLNVLLPGAVVGGDVYRAVALQRSGAATGAATWSVLLDRISGLWMLCAVGVLGAAACAPQLAAWLHLPAPAWLAAPMLVAAALWLALPLALPWLLARRQGTWINALAAALRRPGYWRQLAWQAGASALVQLLSALALAGGALALGVHQPPAAWIFACAPIFLMAALPVSVGGWGTREAAAVAALAPFGVAAPAAIGVGLLYGAFALAQGALGALAFGLPRRAARAADAP